ncbi:hypothetical protein [Mesorhizobium sp. AA22]|uniref:hypothetical protein n=1 Tax=Mesorhizobium sp. AA22 TaxID=1854057 RepID=UPI0007EE0FB5|nr:hypothetical protein [Mesorhizobium sp. AA22]QIA23965.1 hypothetical protein A9K68_020925 [Mesorhizobium sp. AA22]
MKRYRGRGFPDKLANETSHFRIPFPNFRPGTRKTCSDLFTRFVGTSVEEGSDFLPVDAVIAVLVDGVEYPPDEILNFGLRKRTIAVGVHYGEHHSHPCAMHHPASHSAPVMRTSAEIAMPTVATSSFCSGPAMLLHSLLQHLGHHLTHHIAHGVFGWPAHSWRWL